MSSRQIWALFLTQKSLGFLRTLAVSPHLVPDFQTPFLLCTWLVALVSLLAGNFNPLFTLFLEAEFVGLQPSNALTSAERQCQRMGHSNARTQTRFVIFWVGGSSRQACVLSSSILFEGHRKQWGSSPTVWVTLGK